MALGVSLLFRMDCRLLRSTPAAEVHFRLARDSG